MPQLERWDSLPERVRQHLIERMRDREISVSDPNQLRLWVETRPEAPEGDLYKDRGRPFIITERRCQLSWQPID
jgi:hypothetical protein